MSQEIELLKNQIITTLDIRTFYEEYLDGQQLKETQSDGWTDRVLCPLHGDTGTPNFFVNVKTGGFKCHACAAGGSVFDFWILKNGLSLEDKKSFAKAIVALSDRCGITLKQWSNSYRNVAGTPESGDKQKQDKPTVAVINKADANDASKLPIPREKAEGFHKALTADHYKFLNQQRGLTQKTIADYLIGWDIAAWGKTPQGDSFKGRYTIPIPGKDGLIRNIRIYSNQCSSEQKMMNTKNFGTPARLFCLDRLLKNKWDHILITEGEWDCILLNQKLQELGLTSWGALTGTHGANTFSGEWMEYLFGKNLYFCYDCDPPGKAAVENHATRHFAGPIKAGKFTSVKIITLPLDGTKDDKDITDYFVKHGFTAEDFIKLVNSSPEVIVGGVTNDEATVEAIEVDSLITAMKDRRFIDCRITVPLTISGQSSRIYHAIRSYKVSSCPKMAKGDCCNSDCQEKTIPYGHPLFIQSCMANKGIIAKELTELACQGDNRGIKIEPIKKVVMEEYFAHQTIERWRAEEGDDGKMQNSQELVQCSIYVLQPPDNMEIGMQNYMATGWIRSHPNTQVATLFVENLMPLEEDWKKFTLENKEHRESIQRIKTEFTTDQIVSEIVNNVTRIYEADDILYAILLTYLSPIAISFNGQLIRGWVNAAILGDSGTGKSATYSRVSDWLDLGDLFSVLSGTRTGLLYAIKQKAGEWHVQVGRYVQASGKIIMVDETQETTPEDIKRMAIAMDTGWLEVSQVASGGYRTQTRTLFAMNAKLGKTISDFAHGCDALRECFDPMFIRRLDLAVFVTGKHKYSFYNSVHKPSELEPARLTSRLFKSLVYWAWTRRADNIIWQEEATKACLDSATRLSEIYGHADDIPLVNPQDFRNNLARLSTAYSILCRNFTDDLESVTVTPQHVKAMETLVDTIYSSDSCNLRQKSKQSRRRNTLDDFEKISTNFSTIIKKGLTSPNSFYAKANHFCQLLLLLQQLEYIRKRDLQEQLGVSLTWIQKRIAVLQAYNLIELHRSGYKTTRKFNLFMQQWSRDPEVEAMLETVHVKIGEEAFHSDDTDDYLHAEESHSNYSSDPFGSSNE